MKLEFNPDCNTVKEVKQAAMVLRDLINRRNMLETSTDPKFDRSATAEAMLNSFDTLTQNIEV